jgi:hypothetical protein
MITITHYDAGIVYSYMVGGGYLFQVIAFSFNFPYVIFYAATLLTFSKQNRTPEIIIREKLEQIQEPLDLDRLIAQEKTHETEGD